ncbi:hypothetical protein Q1695_009844 [Nippostrongylus brasiliensis]|nr:hypothetical protein Q1695_009844 [Nippostrongylus brasiliensis]
MRKSCCTPLRHAITCWTGSAVSHSDSTTFEKSKCHTEFSHIVPPEKEPPPPPRPTSWDKELQLDSVGDSASTSIKTSGETTALSSGPLSRRAREGLKVEAIHSLII